MVAPMSPPAATPVSPITQMNRIPAMKNSAPHTSAMRVVWPKSGCATRTTMVANSSTIANALAGTSGLLANSANSQAVRMTNAGLRNSEGWMLTPRMISQRRAPLISAPKNSVPITIAKLTAKTISATRRIWRGESSDVPSITATAGIR